jgi:hypothetical protein
MGARASSTFGADPRRWLWRRYRGVISGSAIQINSCVTGRSRGCHGDRSTAVGAIRRTAARGIDAQIRRRSNFVGTK